MSGSPPPRSISVGDLISQRVADYRQAHELTVLENNELRELVGKLENEITITQEANIKLAREYSDALRQKGETDRLKMTLVSQVAGQKEIIDDLKEESNRIQQLNHKNESLSNEVHNLQTQLEQSTSTINEMTLQLDSSCSRLKEAETLQVDMQTIQSQLHDVRTQFNHSISSVEHNNDITDCGIIAEEILTSLAVPRTTQSDFSLKSKLSLISQTLHESNPLTITSEVINLLGGSHDGHVLNQVANFLRETYSSVAELEDLSCVSSSRSVPVGERFTNVKNIIKSNRFAEEAVVDEIKQLLGSRTPQHQPLLESILSVKSSIQSSIALVSDIETLSQTTELPSALEDRLLQIRDSTMTDKKTLSTLDILAGEHHSHQLNSNQTVGLNAAFASINAPTEVRTGDVNHGVEKLAQTLGSYKRVMSEAVAILAGENSSFGEVDQQLSEAVCYLRNQCPSSIMRYVTRMKESEAITSTVVNLINGITISSYEELPSVLNQCVESMTLTKSTDTPLLTEHNRLQQHNRILEEKIRCLLSSITAKISNSSDVVKDVNDCLTEINSMNLQQSLLQVLVDSKDSLNALRSQVLSVQLPGCQNYSDPTQVLFSIREMIGNLESEKQNTRQLIDEQIKLLDGQGIVTSAESSLNEIINKTKQLTSTYVNTTNFIETLASVVNFTSESERCSLSKNSLLALQKVISSELCSSAVNKKLSSNLTNGISSIEELLDLPINSKHQIHESDVERRLSIIYDSLLQWKHVVQNNRSTETEIQDISRKLRDIETLYVCSDTSLSGNKTIYERLLELENILTKRVAEQHGLKSTSAAISQTLSLVEKSLQIPECNSDSLKRLQSISESILSTTADSASAKSQLLLLEEAVGISNPHYTIKTNTSTRLREVIVNIDSLVRDKRDLVNGTNQLLSIKNNNEIHQSSQHNPISHRMSELFEWVSTISQNNIISENRIETVLSRVNTIMNDSECSGGLSLQLERLPERIFNKLSSSTVVSDSKSTISFLNKLLCEDSDDGGCFESQLLCLRDSVVALNSKYCQLQNTICSHIKTLSSVININIPTISNISSPREIEYQLSRLQQQADQHHKDLLTVGNAVNDYCEGTHHNLQIVSQAGGDKTVEENVVVGSDKVALDVQSKLRHQNSKISEIVKEVIDQREIIESSLCSIEKLLSLESCQIFEMTFRERCDNTIRLLSRTVSDHVNGSHQQLAILQQIQSVINNLKKLSNIPTQDVDSVDISIQLQTAITLSQAAISDSNESNALIDILEKLIKDPQQSEEEFQTSQSNRLQSLIKVAKGIPSLVSIQKEFESILSKYCSPLQPDDYVGALQSVSHHYECLHNILVPPGSKVNISDQARQIVKEASCLRDTLSLVESSVEPLEETFGISIKSTSSCSQRLQVVLNILRQQSSEELANKESISEQLCRFEEEFNIENCDIPKSISQRIHTIIMKLRNKTTILRRADELITSTGSDSSKEVNSDFISKLELLCSTYQRQSKTVDVLSSKVTHLESTQSATATSTDLVQRFESVLQLLLMKIEMLEREQSCIEEIIDNGIDQNTNSETISSRVKLLLDDVNGKISSYESESKKIIHLISTSVHNTDVDTVSGVRVLVQQVEGLQSEQNSLKVLLKTFVESVFPDLEINFDEITNSLNSVLSHSSSVIKDVVVVDKTIHLFEQQNNSKVIPGPASLHQRIQRVLSNVVTESEAAVSQNSLIETLLSSIEGEQLSQSLSTSMRIHSATQKVLNLLSDMKTVTEVISVLEDQPRPDMDTCSRAHLLAQQHNKLYSDMSVVNQKTDYLMECVERFITSKECNNADRLLRLSQTIDLVKTADDCMKKSEDMFGTQNIITANRFEAIHNCAKQLYDHNVKCASIITTIEQQQFQSNHHFDTSKPKTSVSERLDNIQRNICVTFTERKDLLEEIVAMEDVLNKHTRRQYDNEKPIVERLCLIKSHLIDDTSRNESVSKSVEDIVAIVRQFKKPSFQCAEPSGDDLLENIEWISRRVAAVKQQTSDTFDIINNLISLCRNLNPNNNNQTHNSLDEVQHSSNGTHRLLCGLPVSHSENTNIDNIPPGEKKSLSDASHELECCIEELGSKYKSSFTNSNNQHDSLLSIETILQIPTGGKLKSTFERTQQIQQHLSECSAVLEDLEPNEVSFLARLQAFKRRLCVITTATSTTDIGKLVGSIESALKIKPNSRFPTTISSRLENVNAHIYSAGDAMSRLKQELASCQAVISQFESVMIISNENQQEPAKTGTIVSVFKSAMHFIDKTCRSLLGNNYQIDIDLDQLFSQINNMKTDSYDYQSLLELTTSGTIDLKQQLLLLVSNSRIQHQPLLSKLVHEILKQASDNQIMEEVTSLVSKTELSSEPICETIKKMCQKIENSSSFKKTLSEMVLEVESDDGENSLISAVQILKSQSNESKQFQQQLCEILLEYHNTSSLKTSSQVVEIIKSVFIFQKSVSEIIDHKGNQMRGDWFNKNQSPFSKSEIITAMSQVHDFVSETIETSNSVEIISVLKNLFEYESAMAELTNSSGTLIERMKSAKASVVELVRLKDFTTEITSATTVSEIQSELKKTFEYQSSIWSLIQPNVGIRDSNCSVKTIISDLLRLREVAVNITGCISSTEIVTSLNELFTYKESITDLLRNVFTTSMSHFDKVTDTVRVKNAIMELIELRQCVVESTGEGNQTKMIKRITEMGEYCRVVESIISQSAVDVNFTDGPVERARTTISSVFQLRESVVDLTSSTTTTEIISNLKSQYSVLNSLKSILGNISLESTRSSHSFIEIAEQLELLYSTCKRHTGTSSILEMINLLNDFRGFEMKTSAVIGSDCDLINLEKILSSLKEVFGDSSISELAIKLSEKSNTMVEMIEIFDKNKEIINIPTAHRLINILSKEEMPLSDLNVMLQSSTGSDECLSLIRSFELIDQINQNFTNENTNDLVSTLTKINQLSDDVPLSNTLCSCLDVISTVSSSSLMQCCQGKGMNEIMSVVVEMFQRIGIITDGCDINQGLQNLSSVVEMCKKITSSTTFEEAVLRIDFIRKQLLTLQAMSHNETISETLTAAQHEIQFCSSIKERTGITNTDGIIKLLENCCTTDNIIVEVCKMMKSVVGVKQHSGPHTSILVNTTTELQNVIGILFSKFNNLVQKIGTPTAAFTKKTTLTDLTVAVETVTSHVESLIKLRGSDCSSIQDCLLEFSERNKPHEPNREVTSDCYSQLVGLSTPLRTTLSETVELLTCNSKNITSKIESLSPAVSEDSFYSSVNRNPLHSPKKNKRRVGTREVSCQLKDLSDSLWCVMGGSQSHKVIPGIALQLVELSQSTKQVKNNPPSGVSLIVGLESSSRSDVINHELSEILEIISVFFSIQQSQLSTMHAEVLSATGQWAVIQQEIWSFVLINITKEESSSRALVISEYQNAMTNLELLFTIVCQNRNQKLSAVPVRVVGSQPNTPRGMLSTGRIVIPPKPLNSNPNTPVSSFTTTRVVQYP